MLNPKPGSTRFLASGWLDGSFRPPRLIARACGDLTSSALCILLTVSAWAVLDAKERRYVMDRVARGQPLRNATVGREAHRRASHG